MDQCPCHSGASYPACCEPYHAGYLPKNALLLMRSRYAAYSFGNADYIMATTHPDYRQEKNEWVRNIIAFSETTTFKGLDVIHFKEKGENAQVTFTAWLEQRGKDTSFTEESCFKKVGERWFYAEGKLSLPQQ